MRKFLHDCKGAVTVMVTLLLIPAILVSGTGVDLARIYAARSTMQDANQLAANSALASYNALLQDLYGLFGMMEGDPELADLMDRYVRAAFQSDEAEQESGNFQLFYGTAPQSGDVVVTPIHDLDDVDVLRHQIEEYSKFRAPAIIATRLMDKLEAFEKIQEDAKVIKTKMEVDDGVEELEELYRKIYDQIQILNRCKPQEEEMMADITLYALGMQDICQGMQSTRESYAEEKARYKAAESAYALAEANGDGVAMETAAKNMADAKKKMGELEKSYAEMQTSLKAAGLAYEGLSNEYAATLRAYKEILNTLLEYCIEADEKKSELSEKIDKLENSLDSGKCSTALVEGLETGDPSIIEQYRALIKYELGEMSGEMKSVDDTQIEETCDIMRDADLGGIRLIDFKSMEFPLEGEGNPFAGILSANPSYLPAPGRDGDGFLDFVRINKESKEFYRELEKLYSTTQGNGADKKKLKKAVTAIFKKAQDLFGGLTFDPEGAEYLENGANTSLPSSGTTFGTGGDWSTEDAGKDELESSLDDDFLSKLADAGNEVGGKILLLAYDTEMFSDSSTPGSEDKEKGYPVENMAGIPLSTDVNYYFQSELEYLYNGNLADAKANLRSVAGMIFLVRFVLNYVASFSINSVNSTVNMVRSALAWTGPFAVLAGELARLALSVGEAAIDVSRLRNGDEVALYKTENAKGTTWRLSIGGLADAAISGLSEAAIDSSFDSASVDGSDTGDDDEGSFTLTYTDYMRLFLLLVPGDTLGRRTAKLIELNVTNYRDKINADEEKMAAADRFDLSEAVTSFEVSTTVELRMLFLSMPFAQKGINGVVPPATLPITVTDYRGY